MWMVRRTWSAANDSLLIALKKQGLTCRAIGALLRRSEQSVASRVSYLRREERLASLLKAQEERESVRSTEEPTTSG
jgi:hypothetical protein